MPSLLQQLKLFEIADVRPSSKATYQWRPVRLYGVNDSFVALTVRDENGNDLKTYPRVYFDTEDYFDSGFLWYSEHDSSELVRRPEVGKESFGLLLVNDARLREQNVPPQSKALREQLRAMSLSVPKWPKTTAEDPIEDAEP